MIVIIMKNYIIGISASTTDFDNFFLSTAKSLESAPLHMVSFNCRSFMKILQARSRDYEAIHAAMRRFYPTARKRKRSDSGSIWEILFSVAFTNLAETHLDLILKFLDEALIKGGNPVTIYGPMKLFSEEVSSD